MSAFDSRVQLNQQAGFVGSRYNIVVPLKAGRALLFNSVTEQLALLSTEEQDAFSHLLQSAVDEQVSGSRFAKLLVAGGYMVPVSRQERESLSRRFEHRRNVREHLTITIATTLGCNLACGYCFQGKDKPMGKLTEETHHRLIEFVRRKASSLRSLGIVWYGGEPLMNARAIWSLSEEVKAICAFHDIQFQASIITNGYLLTVNTAKALLDANVSQAQVTIDGLQDSHDRMRPHISGRGSFDRIIDNIERVVEETSLRVTIRISLDHANAEGVRALLIDLARRGLSGRSNFNVYFAQIEAISSGCADYADQSVGKQSYALLETELIGLAVGLKLHQHGRFGQDGSLCQAVRPADLVLTPNGDLHKCWDTVSYSKLKIANISDEGFEEALASNPWTEWRGADHPICANCKILPICGGGCAFKTVHPSEQTGEAKLPCISLKFNLAERLFQVALAAGLVVEEDWDVDVSPTMTRSGLKTGTSHFESVGQ